MDYIVQRNEKEHQAVPPWSKSGGLVVASMTNIGCRAGFISNLLYIQVKSRVIEIEKNNS